MPRPTIARVNGLLLAFLVVPGCKTARQSPPNFERSEFASASPPTVERKRDILTFKEIFPTRATTAYEAVAQLRPEFLVQHRAVNNGGDVPAAKPRAADVTEDFDARFPNVFLNGHLQGGPASLRSIAASTIIEIRHYHGQHTPTIYGSHNPGGVIDVRTRP